MSIDENISLEILKEYDLVGRPYLHEQGQYVGRGFVESLTVEDGRWTLAIRDIEYLNKSDETWRFDEDKDEYSGDCERTTFRDTSLGFFTISGYGAEVYIGPHTKAPWVEIDWPELDGFGGGPMDLSGLTKRELRKLKKRRR